MNYQKVITDLQHHAHQEAEFLASFPDPDESPDEKAMHKAMVVAVAAIKKLLAERDHLRSGIKEVLTDNAHLADGEICTLIKLKRLVPEWDQEFLGGSK